MDVNNNNTSTWMLHENKWCSNRRCIYNKNLWIKNTKRENNNEKKIEKKPLGGLSLVNETEYMHMQISLKWENIINYNQMLKGHDHD